MSAAGRCCRKTRPMSIRQAVMGNNRLRNEEFLNQLSPCGPTSEMLFFGPVSKIIFRQHRSIASLRDDGACPLYPDSDRPADISRASIRRRAGSSPQWARPIGRPASGRQFMSKRKRRGRPWIQDRVPAVLLPSRHLLRRRGAWTATWPRSKDICGAARTNVS